MSRFSFLPLCLATFWASNALAQYQLNVEEVGTHLCRTIPESGASTDGIESGDTLNLTEFGNQYLLYTSGTGFVFGTDVINHGFGTSYRYEHASGFQITGPKNISGVMLEFCAKEAVSSVPSDIVVKMYSIADDMALGSSVSQYEDAPGPSAIINSAQLPFNDALFYGQTIVMFPEPQQVNSDFAIAIDIEDLYANPESPDKIAACASANGQSDGTYTWTKFGQEDLQTFWAVTSQFFNPNLNVYLAIFAIVSNTPSSIEESGYVNGVSLRTSPNPAMSGDVIRLEYALESGAKSVDLSVFDMNGRIVYSISEGARLAGTHSVHIPSGTLASGSYICSVTADQRRLALKMEVLR